jgi:hypothetical protein
MAGEGAAGDDGVLPPIFRLEVMLPGFALERKLAGGG